MNQQENPNALSEQIKNFKFHKDVSHVTSLHFISTVQNKSDRIWFDIPASGDYEIDCRTGSVCAEMLIKALREDKEYCGGNLQNIILSLLERKESNHKLQGLIVGFFSRLCFEIQWSAVNGGGYLDDVTFDELIDKVIAGLEEAE